MRRAQRLSSAALAAFLVAGVANAGSLSGTIKCKGVRDATGAIVYVASIPGKAFSAPKDHAMIDQKNLVFLPHVLPVLVGTTIDFKNSDAVLHNVFSPDACAEKFNLGTWPKGETRSFTFKQECVAVLLCKVHPEMEAFVLASPTPYFAATKADGSYSIADIPDGSYTVKVWHPKLRTAEKAVVVTGATTASFELAK